MGRLSKIEKIRRLKIGEKYIQDDGGNINEYTRIDEHNVQLQMLSKYTNKVIFEQVQPIGMK